MTRHAREVVVGLVLGVAPLLLLDLAQQLQRAAVGDPEASTRWWSLGVFVLVGVVVTGGMVLGARQRLVPVIATAVLGLCVLPGLPGQAFAWLPEVPMVTAVAEDLTGTVLVIFGAYAYAAVRGARGH